MFNSISNNFGTGTIQFRDYQSDNYVVLNAKFTYDTTNAAYQAADVLEIKVPDLAIDRSVETGVIMRFVDRGTKSGYAYISDGGTVLKSWIKDKNTICIEKLTAFDGYEEMIIYIQSLYCQLARGANTAKGVTASIKIKQGTKCLTWGTDNVCVIHDRWAFLHLRIDGAIDAQQDADWRCLIEGFPLDIDIDIPLAMTYCYQNTLAGGVNECHIKESFWSMATGQRNDGFSNTGNNVFLFGFFVRNNEPIIDVEGRLDIAENPIKGSGTDQIFAFELEMSPSLSLAYMTGSMGKYGSTSHIVYPKSVPERMPDFKMFLVGRGQTGSGLWLQLDSVELTTIDSKRTIKVSNLTGMNLVSVKLFDTGIGFSIS